MSPTSLLGIPTRLFVESREWSPGLLDFGFWWLICGFVVVTWMLCEMIEAGEIDD